MNKIKSFVFSLLFLALAAPVFAVAGRVSGTVKDPDGNPIEGVTITLVATGDVPQTYTARTNKKGEYIHIGVAPGKYRITPSKEGYVPVEVAYIDTEVHLANPTQADFKMQLASKVAAQQSQEQPGTKGATESEQVKAARAGVALLNEGKVDEAIESLKKAIAADPNLAAAHYNLGVAYQRKGSQQDAMKEYEEAAKVKPDFGEAYLALGNSDLDAKNFDGAVEPLSKASTLMPTNYIASYNLGVAYANTGKYAEAEGAFRKAVEINPKEPVVHYQLAMSLLGQTKNAEAKAEFQKYLELNPNAADKKEVEDLLQTLQ